MHTFSFWHLLEGMFYPNITKFDKEDLLYICVLPMFGGITPLLRYMVVIKLMHNFLKQVTLIIEA